MAVTLNEPPIEILSSETNDVLLPPAPLLIETLPVTEKAAGTMMMLLKPSVAVTDKLPVIVNLLPRNPIELSPVPWLMVTLCRSTVPNREPKVTFSPPARAV